MNVVVICEENNINKVPSLHNIHKQFMPLVNGKSTFKNILLGFEYLKTDDLLFQKSIEINRYIIICNKEHHSIVEEQIKELELAEHYTIETEPMGKDTAAVVATAALMGDGEDISLVVPCDDHVFNDEEFCNVVKMGYNNYVDNTISTFGMNPKYPEIFMFQNRTMIRCFEKYALGIFTPCLDAAIKSLGTIDDHTIHLDEEEFLKCPKISMEYAIIDNLIKDTSSDIKVINLTFFLE